MQTLNGEVPEFFEQDRVEVTAGLHAGVRGTVVFKFEGYDTYLVQPDQDDSYVIQTNGVYLRLIEPVQVVDPLKIGMTSDDLANYVGEFIQDCQARVRGVGDQQYSQGTHQKFEAMSLDELLEWAQEEIQDVAVYSAMLDIRLRRVREALKDRL